MKLRYILGVLCLAGMLFSCAEEEAIMLSPITTEKVTIGIDLGLSESIASKAIVKDKDTGEVSYEWASSDELQVNKCFIGIFDAEGNLVVYRNATDDELLPRELGENDVNELEGTYPSYHFNNIEVSAGTGMKLMAIANSQHDLPGD
ncbi:hypothetical protein M2480_000293 [Parabacteroides sp. PFB2-12]|uniref:hypothetical protein n=1 Tax=unclassified Parabacteroides TaxID=2649774 RepID=UPI002476BC10|nr:MULTISPECIES: hypothetical protein [unclassified Parabacteroides]MDH6341541.1 hypothetical protein [Parabacteroides sp. PM6-13]MDH6389335.1 hypothetical protein [Parabacteroides sp. PFB2-12]